ncbi:DUF2079 domain-containing protein [Streptomyces sp. NPDC052496]|uniref:DUF2079 domain-containing protein n=1 Tax=Streptomyces sp. NPDC052496 TaxID=3154951 RepID=UPI00343A3D99
MQTRRQFSGVVTAPPRCGNDAVLRGDAGRLGSAWGRHAVIALAVCFILNCAVGYQAWASLRVAGFDLGIFDQGMRAYAHLGLPVSPIKNYHHEFPEGFSLLGDHLSPVLALLAPLYWIWDDPRTLIIAQSALFASGVPLVRRIAQHCLREASAIPPRAMVNVIGYLYALGWPLLNASGTGFHEVAFAVPFALCMLERGLAGRHGAAASFAVLLSLTKEDLGLVAGAFGVVLLLRSRRRADRRGTYAGAAITVVCPAISVLAIKVLIPWMGGPPGYYWSYGRIGADFPDMVVRAVTEPWVLLQVATAPFIKVLLIIWLLGTLAFLPLGSPTVLLAVPLIAERVLSDNPNHWPAINHYDAFLWPILLTAAVETFSKVLGPGHRRRRPVKWLIATVAAAGIAASLSVGGLIGLFMPSGWNLSPEKKALLQAADQVPDGAFIEADNNIAPRLTPRTKTVIVDLHPRGAEYVLIRTTGRIFPFASPDQQRERVSLLLHHGYRSAWERDGVYLLRRTGASDGDIPGSRTPEVWAGAGLAKDAPPDDVGISLFGR